MAATKKLAKEDGISIQEAERWLNADAFLDEYPSWGPHRLHFPFLIYWMFAHTVATGQKEYDCAICWGWQQPLPEWDLSAEPSAVELIGPRSTREQIRGVYNDMYQLQRSPGKCPCDVVMEERTCHEILDSIKECLLCRWDCAQPEEGPRWSSNGASRPDLLAKFQDRMCATYDHFKDLREESCEEALAVVKDTHWWALVATALLKEKIERLSHSLSCGHWLSRSYKHSGSHHKRSKAGSHQDRAPQAEVHQGGSSKRQAQSPTPGSQGGTSLLRMVSKRTPELGSPIHLPGETWKRPGWKRRTCLPETLTWKVSWLEQKGKMTPSRPCHISPPTMTVLSGSGGKQSSATPQHDGGSSLWSPARVTSKSSWGWSRHCSSCPW